MASKVRGSGAGRRLAAAALIVFCFGLADAAKGEVQFSVYAGWNESFNSDVSVTQPNGTNMALKGVPWSGDSFSGPIYWGVRGTYWLDRNPNWGIAIDFTHAKAKAKLGKRVQVSGRRDGAAVGGTEPVGSTFSMLEFTDGLNLLTLNALYRWPIHPWTPYAGIGIGAAIPHVEVQRVGQAFRTFEYQLTGLAAQGLVGVDLELSDHWSVFFEYKLSYARIDADLTGGGSLQTDLWTNHVLFGLSYRFDMPTVLRN